MLHAWAAVPIGSLGIAPYFGVWTRELSVGPPTSDSPSTPTRAYGCFRRSRVTSAGMRWRRPSRATMDRRPVAAGFSSTWVPTRRSSSRRMAGSWPPPPPRAPRSRGCRSVTACGPPPGAMDVVTFGDDGRVSTNVIGGGPAHGDLRIRPDRRSWPRCCGPASCRQAATCASRVKSQRTSRPRSASASSKWTASRRSRLSRPATCGAATGVHLTARDIREVQLAKGSIMTAATLACRHVGFDVLRSSTRCSSPARSATTSGSRAPAGSAWSRHRPGADPPRRERRGRRCPARAAGPRGVGRARSNWPEHAESIELATAPGYQATFMDAAGVPSHGTRSKADPMNLLELCARVVVCDGAMGTELQRAGLAIGECGERWASSMPDACRRFTRPTSRPAARRSSPTRSARTAGCWAATASMPSVEAVNRAAAAFARSAAGERLPSSATSARAAGSSGRSGDVDAGELEAEFSRQARRAARGGRGRHHHRDDERDSRKSRVAIRGRARCRGAIRRRLDGVRPRCRTAPSGR